MNLFIDDLRPCPAGWILARTITKAIEILATVEVDIVSLDHDIEYHTSVRFGKKKVPIEVESPENFQPVARYIALMPERPAVQYHTANPEGESIMRGILDNP